MCKQIRNLVTALLIQLECLFLVTGETKGLKYQDIIFHEGSYQLIRLKRKSLADYRSPQRTFSCLASYTTKQFIKLQIMCRLCCLLKNIFRFFTQPHVNSEAHRGTSRPYLLIIISLTSVSILLRAVNHRTLRL